MREERVRNYFSSRIILPFVILLLISFPASGFSLKEWKASLNESVRQEAEKSFSAMFGGRVTIARAGGVIVGQIDLYDVNFPNIGRAKKVILYFNPLKYVFAKGDVVPALTNIAVENGAFAIRQEPGGQWNIMSFFQSNGAASSGPPPFKGTLALKNCRLGITNFPDEITEINGLVNLKEQGKVGLSFAAKTLGGKVLANSKVRLEAKTGAPQVNGSLKIDQVVLYGQKASGTLNFNFKDGVLTVKTDKLKAYQGKLGANCVLDLNGREPKMDLSVKASQINLAILAQNSPGIEGRASGQLALAGPLSKLSGTISTRLSRTKIAGQEMAKWAAAFRLEGGAVYIDSFQASNNDVSVSARGQISRNLVLDLWADASGLLLSGQGLLGKMQAKVEKFNGAVSLQLGREFIDYPLRSLSASGEVILTGGRIGQQTFDSARGRISIGRGRVRVETADIVKGNSVVRISGETGVGLPTRLMVACPKLNLADLKILNQFLPPEAQDPTGNASIEIKVSGELPRETRLSSFDPLLDLKAEGSLQLSEVNVGGIPIVSSRADLLWEKRILSFKNARVTLPDSNLRFDLSLLPDGGISGLSSGSLNLVHLRQLWPNLGKLSGFVGFGLGAEGSSDDPALSADFWVANLSLFGVDLDRLSGKAVYARDQLIFVDPLTFTSGQDKYSLTGGIIFDREEPANSWLGLKLQANEIEMSSAYRLYNKIVRGLLPRLIAQPSENFSRIDLADANTAFPQSPVLFHSNGANHGTIKYWQEAKIEAQQRLAASPEERLGGTLSAQAEISGPFSHPGVDFNASLKNGLFRNYSFDSLAVSGSLDAKSVDFTAELDNGAGKLLANGFYSFDNNIAVDLSARRLPADALNLFLPDSQFKGELDLDASVSGLLSNPSFSLEASSQGLGIPEINYDAVRLSVSKDHNLLTLNNFSVQKGGQLSSVSGSLTLDNAGAIDLSVDLKDDAVGLVNALTNAVRWKKGQGYVLANVTGTFEKPDINGQVFLKDVSLFIPILGSNINNLSCSASIESGLVSLANLSGVWQGKKTRDFSNNIALWGSIDIANALSNNGSVNLDLSLAPTSLSLFFPGLYTGGLTVKQLTLQGPLFFDFSRGPTLSGALDISNAVINLAPPKGGTGKPFPLKLDLDAQLSKNVYATMGDIATLDLSNILMDLEISGGLKVSGDLDAPSLLGKIDVKRGTINIFNREFTLLTPDMQKKFFPYDDSGIQNNIANFSSESGPAGIMPRLNITASVNVENEEKDTSGKMIKKQVVILSRISGTPGTKEEERALTISLRGFTEDKIKSPYEMVPAAYSEQDLRVMLLPDFIKALAGLNQPQTGDSKVDTNAVVADYLNSRVQSLFFRSFERGAEQALGLESLTLEYNFGPGLREAMGAKDPRGFSQDKPAWSVGFVKGFFDRLYIDVRYAQGFEQPSANTGNAAMVAFNYQLTYKLNPIWSIIYYREPLNLTAPVTGYQKLTLKAGFYLW